MAKEQEKKNTPSSKSSTTAGIGIKINQECFKINNFCYNLNNLSFMTAENSETKTSKQFLDHSVGI